MCEHNQEQFEINRDKVIGLVALLLKSGEGKPRKTWEERVAVLKPRYMAASHESVVDELLSVIMVNEHNFCERKRWQEEWETKKDDFESKITAANARVAEMHTINEATVKRVEIEIDALTKRADPVHTDAAAYSDPYRNHLQRSVGSGSGRCSLATVQLRRKEKCFRERNAANRTLGKEGNP